ncbi:hypothetical protein EGW08_005645 [Elysia chlorotica]|uniref:EGF-like domain-containing protein n=1 Tax=Elysia chlorotica TaxID=188477 RepID=A0A433TYG6_ELYCH|nr:hypothetical protein EGW08_005645 [Elysia chlorotica]
MSRLSGGRLGVLTLLVAALVIPSQQEEVVKKQLQQVVQNCQQGAYFDVVNQVCLVLPIFCPSNSVRDTVVGCRCSQGLAYNGLRGACEVATQTQQSGCPVGQYFDTVNNRCLYSPTTCPYNAAVDATLGCRCQSGYAYNGLSGQCQVQTQQTTCSSGQYFDTVNSRCLTSPTTCPFPAIVDVTMGCRCQNGQVYNGVTRQCQIQTQQTTCSYGQYFDTVNNVCLTSPQTCPYYAVVDAVLGCRCQNGQVYNGVSRQCQTQTQQTTCSYGQYFDTVNSRCLTSPTTCPYYAVVDAVLGCRCQNGQVYNGVTRQCQNQTQQTTCSYGQYFDTVNNRCLTSPQTCPYYAVVDAVMGCRCQNGQVYNGVSRQCQTQTQQTTCSYGQYFDTVNNVCLTSPQTCPYYAVVDAVLGCRCQNGQVYNGVSRQCQTQTQQTTCSYGQYFDTVNNRCLTSPTTCPYYAVVDVTMGCRCQNGQVYNGVTRQCQTQTQQTTCSYGQYFDTVNNVCLTSPQTCPYYAVVDAVLGCRCQNGQVYNGVSRQCQTTQQQTCPSGQYYDTTNSMCYNIPVSCPTGAVRDLTVGCRCPLGQTYNGATQVCGNNTQQQTCFTGQYFDTINNMCYNIPVSCPTGSSRDLTLGCRCPVGQTFNGASQACQSAVQQTCQYGQYFDTVNNVCYPLPTNCPVGATTDSTLGCRCALGLTYNGATGQCRTQTTTTCSRGQFFDVVNRICSLLPLSSQCPVNAPYDQTLGCRCPNAQVYNGVTRQCVAPTA